MKKGLNNYERVLYLTSYHAYLFSLLWIWRELILEDK